MDIKDMSIRSQVSLLDVTKTFPYDNNSVDFIYAEALIEHISQEEAEFMLSECSRVMTSGGITRISTPDINFIMNLKDDDEYTKFISTKFLKMPNHSAVQVINNAFRAWGHTFLYDKKTLISAALSNGFTSYKECKYGESDHTELKNCEEHGKNIGNIPMAVEEAMIMEFIKTNTGEVK